MDSIISKHFSECEKKPEVIVEVPGVTILFGEFANYCKGFSICGASDLKLQAAISLRDDSLVKMSNEFSGDHKRFSLSGIKFRKEDKWGNYVKGVVADIICGNVSLTGMNISFTGDLLACDGATVASAMGLAVCLGVNKLFDLKMDRAQIIRHTYLSCSTFAKEVCKYMVLLTMLDAKPGKLLFFDNQRVSFDYIPYFCDEYSGYKLVVVDSRVPPLAMREETNFIQKSMEQAFLELKKYSSYGLLRDFPLSELIQHIVPIQEDLRQLCYNVLKETKDVKEVINYIKESDYVQVGKILNRNQKRLRDGIEITCPEVDWLVKRAGETLGCLGSSMISTGNSGSILLLLNGTAKESYIKKLEEYEHIFGFVCKVSEFVPRGNAEVIFSKK